jgi:hypothetical protein
LHAAAKLRRAMRTTKFWDFAEYSASALPTHDDLAK